MSDSHSPKILAAALAAALATVMPAHASEKSYNQVSLRAEASQEVNNDLMRVTFYVEARDNDPAKLANQITLTLNKALDAAKKVPNVKVSMGSRSSYPLTSESSLKQSATEIKAWNERGEIIVESQDFSALSQLTGELLKSLQMGSMQFSIAPATREKTEDQLISEAITAFKKRAEIATKAMGGKENKIVNLNLNSNGFGGGVPIMYRAKSASFDSSPNVAGGTGTVTMSADGVIEIN